ncbi:MAG: phosphoribosylaminoimidazolesuccinocarboxamide synthase [Defluviitaleaceae bacterium]|nr:phosphoribosylaminoimidazolesuccinocarboxamide synthase [Defluviitaleaceae bacterium]
MQVNKNCAAGYPRTCADTAPRMGKIRDIYEISEKELVLVTSDRISAFDKILPKTIAGKGEILNKLSLFWFEQTKKIVPNHVISSDLRTMPQFFQNNKFENRTVLVKKLKILPYEFIVRGYMFGHLWDEVGKNGEYKLAEKLKTPILTPSTKSEKGDEYITYEKMATEIGYSLASTIKEICLRLYDFCYTHAYKKGIIIADAKFEFGLDENNNLILADEIFTPDSSRFWKLDEYEVGISPKSYDKQFLRDWLIANNKQFENIPDEIYNQTAKIYAECIQKLTD